jgi:hypothetical protein
MYVPENQILSEWPAYATLDSLQKSDRDLTPICSVSDLLRGLLVYRSYIVRISFAMSRRNSEHTMNRSSMIKQ